MAKLQQKVLKHLRSLKPHVAAVKIIEANENGWPDTVFSYYGRFVGCEIKDGKDRLSVLQHEQLCRIKDTGAIAMVVTSDGNVAALVRQCARLGQMLQVINFEDFKSDICRIKR